MNKLNILKPNYNECEFNNRAIDPQIIIKNKCFHNDILNDDLTVKESLRDTFLIGGVIKFKNNYTFGNNDKGQELYEFQPINWHYPKFLVPSNIKKNMIKNKEKVIDHFVVIKFKEWKTKIPIGYIDRDIGPVDNIINQYEILFNYYPLMPIIKEKTISIKYNEPTNITLDHEIFSIDPIGCIDIDDALSYDFIKNRIGIHIADVAEILNSYNHKRYSTVYAPHKIVHMIPDDIATKMASLKEGEIKNVITCWINKDNSIEFECNKIKVTKNMTYDEAEILKESNNILKILFEKSIELGKTINMQVLDTHKMVEVYMILYNKYITELLSTKKNMIYRNQKLFKKAIYENKCNGHESLGLTHYTHATSPIRRYVDWIIQKIFKNIQFDEVNLDNINEYEKDIKKLSRMWDYLKASKDIISGSEYEIVFREVQDNRLVFWCEKLNIQISNKIGYNLIDNGIQINDKEYIIGEKYNMKLYLIDDKKNILFYKILIQF